ncbi:MAG: signal recognition particle protein, partial [Mycobacteriaceae bacterium]
VKVSDINQLVDRFFDARKMMAQMSGRFGLPGAGGGNRKAVRGKKGKKGKKGGRGPTPPKVRGGMPAGFPGMAGMGPAGSINELPPGLAGFDPSQLKLPKRPPQP